jgi:hypothetical protein
VPLHIAEPPLMLEAGTLVTPNCGLMKIENIQAYSMKSQVLKRDAK